MIIVVSVKNRQAVRRTRLAYALLAYVLPAYVLPAYVLVALLVGQPIYRKFQEST